MENVFRIGIVKNDGCQIKKPAPAAGLACKCHYDDGFKNEKDGYTATKNTCTGEVVPCYVGSLDRVCLEPDLSIRACYNGRGNCGGY